MYSVIIRLFWYVQNVVTNVVKMTLAPKFVCKPWQEGSKGRKIMIVRKM